VALKDMRTGEQRAVLRGELAALVKREVKDVH
jgi:hypothetical protein